LGCTHRPVMLRRDEDWTLMMRASLDDPDMPAEWKDPSRWPAHLREELGNDFGTAAAGRAREVFRRHFAEARRALDAFNPDVIVMFGDDQYENFKEDIVPPFAVLAYEDQDIQPWKHRRSSKYLASGLLEAGIDAAYAYKPLHHPLGHAFENTILLLDDERIGFDYPLVPFSVNCYGRRVNAAHGLRLPLAMRDKIRDSIRPRPTPRAAWRWAPPQRG
jgi:hypothetical protein